MSLIRINNGIVIRDIMPNASGTINIGSFTLPFNGIYADHLYAGGKEISVSGLSDNATNIGTGVGVYAEKTGTTMEFKSLTGTGDVTVSSGTSDIYINAVAPVRSVNGFTGTINLTTTNIPEGTRLYFTTARARESVSVVGPLVYNSGTGIFSIPSGSATQDGYISAYDWTRFNSVAVGSGNYVLKAGDVMTGGLYLPLLSGNVISGNLATINDLTIVNSILPQTSGNVDLGSQAKPFRTIYADDIVDTSGSSNFVRRTGDTMTGPLYVPTLSGNIISGDTIRLGGSDVIVNATNLGTGVTVFAAKSGNNLNFKSLVGLGGVVISNDANNLYIEGGAVLSVNGKTGIVNLTTADIPESGSTNLYFTPARASNYVAKAGDTMSGTLNTRDVTPTTSGIYNLGTLSLPFSGLYVENIFSSTLPRFSVAENEIPFGPINNANKTYTLSNIPLSGSLHLYRDGILVNESGLGAATVDYTLSGSTITMISAPQSDQSLVANYKFASPSGNGLYGSFTSNWNISGNTYDGLNLGSGEGIFYASSISGIITNLEFKSLVANGSTTLSSDVNTIYLNTPTNPASTTPLAIVSWSGLTGGGFLDTSITIVGNDIIPVGSGIGSLGSFASPWSDVYAKTGRFSSLLGMSPITLGSDLIPSGSNINLGSSGNEYNNLYLNNIYISGSRFNPAGVVVPNVIRVSAYSDGGYTNIAPAVASISGASNLMPYVVFVEPGVYSEPEITVPAWVSIVGRDEYSVFIEPTGNNDVFNVEGNGSLAFMQVQNVPVGNVGVKVFDQSDFVILHKVTFFNVGEAINVLAETVDCQVYLEYVDATSNNTSAYQFNFEGRSGNCYVNAENFYSYGDITNPQVALHVSGNTTCLIKTGGFDGVEVAGDAVHVENGASVYFDTVSMNSWNIGVKDYPSLVGSHIELNAVNFINLNTNIEINNSGTSGYLNGYSDVTKTIINQDSSFFVANNDPQILTVAHKGGDFTSVVDAINSISGTVSETNKYIISVGPGIYREPQIIVPSWTYVKGQTINGTIIEPDGNWDAFKLSHNTEVSFLTVQNVPSGYYAFDFTGCEDFGQLHKVSIYSSNGLKMHTVSTNDIGYIEYVDINGPYENAVSITSTSGNSALMNLENFYCFQYDSPAGAIDVSTIGPGAEAELKIGGFVGNSSGIAFYVGNEGRLNSSSITVKDYDTGIFIDDTGATPTVGPDLEISDTTVVNSTSYDYYVKHQYANGVIGGIFERSLVYVNPLNNTISWFNQDPTGGLTVGGDLYMGKQFDQAQYISPLIANSPTMGVTNGGLLSIGTGLTINVGQGYGYLDTDETDWTKTQYISWSGQNFDLTANDDVYIYINSNGIVSKSASSINGDVDKIYLGRVIAGPYNVISANNIGVEASHWSNKADEYLRDVFGAIVADGLVISSSGLQLIMTEGEYYYSTRNYEPTAKDPIPSWLQFWHTTSGVWTAAINSSGIVPNTYYDNGSGLSILTSGYYTRHSMWYNGPSDTMMFTYGQAEYSGLSEVRTANSPIAPPQFKDDVVHLSDIIVQQGSGSVVEIIDTRPVPSYKSSQSVGGGGGVTIHSQLLGLTSDDHPQYLLVNGGRPLSSDLSLGGNNLTNVALIDGVSPSGHGTRHNPNDPDPISTAVPIAIGLFNDLGAANSLSRSDHQHTISGITTDNIIEGSNLYYLDSRARQAISGTSPIVYGTGTGVISIQSGSSTQNGYISSGDWVTFNNKQPSGNYFISGTTSDYVPEGLINFYYTDAKARAVVSGTLPISVNSGLISISQAGPSGNGYLSSGDWVTFNNKQDAGNYLVSGVSTTDAIVEGTGNLFFTNDRARAVVSGTLPISVVSGLVSISAATASTNGYLSSGDWTTFNNKQPSGNYITSILSSGNGTSLVIAPNYIKSFSGINIVISDSNGVVTLSGTQGGTTYSGTSPLFISGTQIGISSGSSTQNGYISSGDWSIFNGKQDALGYTPVNKAGDTLSGALTGTSIFATTFSGTNISGSIVSASSDLRAGGSSILGPQNCLFVYSTGTQTISASGVLQDITFSNTPYIYGWAASGNSNFTCNKNGVYQAKYSATGERTAGVTTTLEIIGLFNGIEISGSQQTQIYNANNLPDNITNEFFFTGVSGQNFKLQMAAPTTTTRIVGKGALASTKPSITLNINPVGI
jgi:hypothetical protein